MMTREGKEIGAKGEYDEKNREERDRQHSYRREKLSGRVCEWVGQ
jgi:hypothetical protein